MPIDLDFAEADDDLAILDLPRDRVRRVFAFRHWLLSTARALMDTHEIVARVGEGLCATGIPLARMVSVVETRHSEHSRVGRVWEPGRPPSEVLIPHGDATSAIMRASPFGVAHETGTWLRFDPRGRDAERFQITEKLREAGFTDYLCVPVLGVDGAHNGFSFATAESGGFSDADIAVFRFVMPALAALQELLATRRILREVARIYLGAEPATRVLSGDVRRGEVSVMRSVIMFSDMRGFTDISMRLSPEETVDLLNGYYDCVVAPVEARGGEVLKFIADGILAIFHAGDGQEREAAGLALEASREALAAVAAMAAAGTAPARFDIGIGLHFGDAGYGNVGSGERQDYTVIGRDVNIASRVAGLCGPLGHALVFSAEFVNLLPPGTATEIGRHALKGVEGESAVFAPNE